MKRLLLCAAVLYLSGSTLASLIGSWDGSRRTWNTHEFTTLKNTMTSAGHTVADDASMTATNLSNYDVFVIGEAEDTPGGSSLNALSSWVDDGGILLVMIDYSREVNKNNNILSGIGCSMRFSQSSFLNSPLAGGVFATETPNNIVGQTLIESPGKSISGGMALAGTFVRYEQIGNGYVFCFGDRSDHNFASPTSANVNGKLFLNIAEVPEPATLGLLALGALLLRKRK